MLSFQRNLIKTNQLDLINYSDQRELINHSGVGQKQPHNIDTEFKSVYNYTDIGKHKSMSVTPSVSF